MLKLITDPTQSPIHEVDLTDNVTGRYRVRPTVKNRNEDHVFPRPQGGSLAVQRPIRRTIEIEAKGLDQDQYYALKRLQEARRVVHVFPNYDRDTDVWAPLTGTLYGYTRNATSGVLEKTQATFSRNASAYYWDEDTRQFVEVGANVPRYMPSNLGPGILMEAGYYNELGRSHPISADLGWNNSASGTLAWDAGAPTPAPGYDGCVKYSFSAGSSAQIVNSSDVVGKGTTSEWFHAQVWMRGRGTVIVSLQGTSSGVIAQKQFRLTEQWQEYRVDGVTGTGVENVSVQLVWTDEAFDTVAWIGPRMVYKQNVETRRQEPAVWHDYNTIDGGTQPDGDGLSVSLAEGVTGYTLAICGRLPLVQSEATAYRLGLSDHRAIFRDAGNDFVVRVGFATLFVNQSGGYADRAGLPFYLAVRVALAADTSDVERGITARYYDPLSGAVVAQDTSPTSSYEELTSVDVGTDHVRPVSRMAPQHTRLDRRAWSDAEMQAHLKLFTNGALRELYLNTQGRLFRYVDDQLAEHPGSGGRLFGSITLEELDYDPDLVVVT